MTLATPEPTPRVPPAISVLGNRYLGANLVEVLLDRRGLVLRHAFLDGLGRAFHQILGRLEAETGDFADDRDERVGMDRARDCFGETLAIDGKSRTRGDAVLIGRTHHERAETPHLFFEQPDRVIELVAAEGVRTDQFAEPVRLVHGGRTQGTHLVQDDRHADGCRLPCGLATRESAADDVNLHGSGRWTLSSGEPRADLTPLQPFVEDEQSTSMP